MSRLAGLAFAAAVAAVAPRAAAEAPPRPAGRGEEARANVRGLRPPTPPERGRAPGTKASPAGAADDLFARGRWAEAAIAYHRAALGAGGRARQIAGYRVAVALHYLGLHQASLGAFALIAADPEHPRFAATLVWLAGLSTALADPDEVVALLGRYDLEDAAPYDNPTQRTIHARMAALLGRHAYRARRFEEAIRAFEKVGPDSPHYPEAELFTALAHVQRRKPEPAQQALSRLRAVLEQWPPGKERRHLLDLVNLSVARISYSRAVVGAGTSGRGPTLDGEAIQGARESYRRVDPEGPSGAEALFESAWVDFMAGDLAHALGTLAVFQADGFQGFVNPEVPVLQGEIAFALCQLDAADAFAARARGRYAPVRREIAALLARLEGEGGTLGFFRVAEDLRAGAASLGPDARAMVQAALSDRQMGRRLAHVRAADGEAALLRALPPAFRASALGAETADAIDLARDVAARNAGALVRARLLRAVDEIDQRLQQAAALSADVASARSLEAGRAEGPRAQALPAFGPVVSDREHEVWPFDGEVWKDELGSYRMPARSRCPR